MMAGHSHQTVGVLWSGSFGCAVGLVCVLLGWRNSLVLAGRLSELGVMCDLIRLSFSAGVVRRCGAGAGHRKSVARRVLDYACAVCSVAGAGFGAGLETFFEDRAALPNGLIRAQHQGQSRTALKHDGAPRRGFRRTLAAPRGPKAVWLPAPPNAPARSAALPLWSSTTMISTKAI